MRKFQVLALLMAIGIGLGGCEVDSTEKIFFYPKNYRPDGNEAQQHEDNAKELIKLGQYREAASIYNEKVVPLLVKLFSPDHPIVHSRHGIIAELYLRLGRYTEAEELVKRALPILEKEHGPDDPAIGRFLLVQASSYLGQGRFSEAEPLVKRALPIIEKKFGSSHPSIAWWRNRMGWQRDGQPVAVEPKVTQPAAPPQSQSKNTMTRPIAFNWDGYSALAAGTVTLEESGKSGQIALSLPKGEATCEGRYEYGASDKGTWALACSNGLAASGTFEELGAGKGSQGSGKDTKGRSVKFIVGARP